MPCRAEKSLQEAVHEERLVAGAAGVRKGGALVAAPAITDPEVNLISKLADLYIWGQPLLWTSCLCAWAS